MAKKLLTPDFFNDKRIEPEPRWVGGEFRRAIHRFPIKGGVSFSDLMVESMSKNNYLLQRIKGMK